MTLSILLWLPLGISVIALLLPEKFVGYGTALASFFTLGVAISFLSRFKHGQPGLQFLTDRTWIAPLGIHYKLGVDGLNASLLVLTTALFTASMVWSAFRETDRPRVYYLMFGMAETGVLGAFLSQDLALFVGFFDLMLIPFFFLVGMYGSGERVQAVTKLVIYTLVGSFFMLVAAVGTAVLANSQHHHHLTFVLSTLQSLPLTRDSQDWIFLCFALAFLVKMPLVPFHGWLADGYKAMPIPAVAVFSGILSKVAAYGFMKIVLPLFPYGSEHFQLLMLMIGLISIIYATSLAFSTDDARLVIAYSSVAQLGFILLGIFSLRSQGEQGALLQMLNHGLVTAPAFFIVAAAAARTSGSEKLADMGGIAMRAPVLATLFLIVSLANLAMPGSSNFIGEFLILLGTFKAKAGIGVIAFVGVVGASVYALRLFITAMHNRQGDRVHSFEIRIEEAAAIVPLVVVILVLAVYPQFGLDRSQAAASETVAAANSGRYAVTQASLGSGTPTPTGKTSPGLVPPPGSGLQTATPIPGSSPGTAGSAVTATAPAATATAPAGTVQTVPPAATPTATVQSTTTGTP